MGAFDPHLRTWVPPGRSGAVPVPAVRGTLVCDEASVRWAAEDFGHLMHHRPRAVLRPGGTADVAAIVAFATRAGLPVAARGAGHATYGQAQTPGGIVIDMACLDQVGEVRAGVVTVQAGALWSQVLDAALAQGYTPPVLTDYLHTTVGGTLVAGGVGGTTHQHGMQVDGVAELNVVTGCGELMTCSPQRNPRLFDAVRAGLGQCGIITSASLRLTPAPARVRCYRLYYRDLVRYLADQRDLVTQGRFDYLEGQIVAAEGGWRYLLEAATHYTPPDVPADAALLAGLGHDCAGQQIEDVAYRDFQHRMAPGEAALRDTGEWLHPHAWLTVFLPEAVTARLVGDILAGLSAADLGHSGLGLLYPVRTERLRAPLVRIPDSDLVWLFALLRTAGVDDPADGSALVQANRAVYDQAVAHGAVAYPINTLPMSAADWRAHFGPRWPRLLAAKAEFDPHGILAPGQGIIVDRGTGLTPSGI
ncbi:MAG: FAD-binding protein [Pseudonocardiaceae bacterium]